MMFDSIRAKRQLSHNTVYTLTDRGRRKLEVGMGNNPVYRIMCALETNGSCDAEDISRHTGLGTGFVSRQLPRMEHAGLIIRPEQSNDDWSK